MDETLIHQMTVKAVNLKNLVDLSYCGKLLPDKGICKGMVSFSGIKHGICKISLDFCSNLL
jgi:hypothetical protein